MNEVIVGVGPHPQPWPIDPRYDPELLAAGDQRNVLDKYRYWSLDAIKADLDQSRSGLHVAIENWQHDFNIGTIVRTANAFNVEAVHVIGRRHWNRRGAMVADRYMAIVHHDTVQDFAAAMQADNRQMIAVDIVPGALPISQVTLPQRSVLIFGGEGPGISDDMKQIVQTTVMIEQFGSTRSVNVGVAAGIAMYVWVQQHLLNRS